MAIVVLFANYNKVGVVKQDWLYHLKMLISECALIFFNRLKLRKVLIT